MGDLFHAALKWIADETKRLNIHMGRLSKSNACNLLNKRSIKLCLIFVHQLLLSTNRYRYIQRKLEQIVA